MRAFSLFLILAITGNALAGVVLKVQQISGCCDACNSCGCEHVIEETTTEEATTTTETTTEEATTTTETTTVAYNPCPEDYLYCAGTDSCYFCSSLNGQDKLSWENASLACQDRHGYLAQITSNEEVECIEELMGTTVQKWIGLNDRENEGTNVWENDNTTNTFQLYLPGTSNNGNNQDCFIIHAPASFVGFEDKPCQSPKHYLCEANPILVK